MEIALFLGTEFLGSLAAPKSVIFGSPGSDYERSRQRLISSLRKKGFFEDSNALDWIPQISEKGKSELFDDLLPQKEWDGAWDGKWRAISFDLPQSARKERHQLTTWLAKRRFGNVQGSLWISHRPSTNWADELKEIKVNPKQVLIFELNPLGQEKAQDFVAAAWNFGKINSAYEEYLAMTKKDGALELTKANTGDWLISESKLWRQAFQIDPFLPNPLLPDKYLGKQAWNQRKQVYAHIAQNLLND